MSQARLQKAELKGKKRGGGESKENKKAQGVREQESGG